MEEGSGVMIHMPLSLRVSFIQLLLYVLSVLDRLEARALIIGGLWGQMKREILWYYN